MADPIELPEVVVTPYDNINHGGTADWWDPHGSTDPYYGFVISGNHVNQDPVSASANSSGAVVSHYYSGYWADVQGTLYAPGTLPPSGPAPYPIPGYGEGELPMPRLEPPNPFFMKPPDIREASSASKILAAIGGAIVGPAEAGQVRGPFDDIIPTPPPDWFTGLFGPSPTEAMIFGPPTPGALPNFLTTGAPPPPPMPGFSPIKGKAYDIFSFIIPDAPTEQEIQDAGNPALWLLPRELGPLDTGISTPAQEPVYIAPGFPPPPTTSTLIPFDITPGNTISDVTP